MFGINRWFQMCKDWHPISVQGVLHTSASNLATCDFCYCRLIYSTRMVADRHRLAARHNKHCWRAFQGYKHRWPWTTLNPKNMGFKWFFCYLRLRRTLRENFRWNILKIDQDNLRTKLTVPSCCRLKLVCMSTKHDFAQAEVPRLLVAAGSQSLAWPH